jgi:hypothetical protein
MQKFQKRKNIRKLRWVAFITGTSPALYFLDYPLSAAVFIVWGIITLEEFSSNRIPVLTWHSISNDGAWIKDMSIVTRLKSFDLQMKWLKKQNYRPLSLDELFNLRLNGGNNGRAVVICLDDGYLDNWVGAYPILQKYKLSATIFVSTGWIDPSIRLREKMFDVPENRLNWQGYLNESELIALQKSGAVDIQSHGHSHDRIFVSDELIGFVSPCNQPVWLQHYFCSEEKHCWFRKEYSVPMGYPIFKNDQALSSAEFKVDRKLIERLITQASEDKFFEKPDWESRLKRTLEEYKSENGTIGSMETELETKKRWKKEITASLTRLERCLEKPINHFCWPQSACCDESEKTVLELGFKSTTRQSGGFNDNRNPHRVERLSMTSCGYPIVDLIRMITEIWVFKGHYVWYPVLGTVQIFTRFKQRKLQAEVL